jgi:hypothetical protein
MEAYICLIMNGARFHAFGIQCANDADALEQVTAILNSQASNQFVEVWHCGRLTESNCSDLSGESDSYPNSR